MESHRLLPFFAGFAISAALLWLGSRRLRHGARPQPAQQPAAWRWSALLSAGCGLWWPGTSSSRARRPAAAFGGIPLVAAGLAWHSPGLPAPPPMVTTRKTLPACAGLSLLTLGVAYAHSLFATPGFSAPSAALGSWGPAGAILILVTMLVGLGLESKPSRKVRTTRLSARRAGALLLTLAAAGPGDGRFGAAARLDRGAAARRPGRDRLGAARNRRHADEAATPSRRGRAAAAAAVPLVDSLTQLPTRVYFEDRLAAAATKCDANASRLALLFIDLDGFKPVNDT
jgi:hypothetical protein